MTQPPTPGQTIGPFYGFALPVAGGEQLVGPSHPGAVRLHGTVYDGAGAPVPDALIEIWQADAEGRVPQVEGSLRRDGWSFTGFGRTATDESGRFAFTTVAPGPTTEGAAPFIAVTVFARGLTNRLFTRVYLPGAGLEGDPFLSGLPEDRRRTLVAVPDDVGHRFDVRLQGEDETVFLAYPEA